MSMSMSFVDIGSKAMELKLIVIHCESEGCYVSHIILIIVVQWNPVDIRTPI